MEGRRYENRRPCVQMLLARRALRDQAGKARDAQALEAPAHDGQANGSEGEVRPRLEARLRDGARGIVAPQDSYKHVCQDALTYLKRKDEQTEILQGFISFAKGFLADTSMHPDALAPLRSRIAAMENDIRRATSDMKGKGC